MANRIIVLTGFGGAGKSTLAGNIATLSPHSEILLVQDIMKESAHAEGFGTVTLLMALRGPTSTSASAQPLLVERINDSLQRGDVIIDEVSFHALFKGLVRTFGRENLFVVSVEAGIVERALRINGRVQSTKSRTLLYEAQKLFAGVRRVMSEADIAIREPSPERAFSAYLSATIHNPVHITAKRA